MPHQRSWDCVLQNPRLFEFCRPRRPPIWNKESSSPNLEKSVTGAHCQQKRIHASFRSLNNCAPTIADGQSGKSKARSVSTSCLRVETCRHKGQCKVVQTWNPLKSKQVNVFLLAHTATEQCMAADCAAVYKIAWSPAQLVRSSTSFLTPCRNASSNQDLTFV